MTAEIGILNRSAVVLAADSAVTIGNGRKVFNTANKIFQLCYKESIGVMIYNSANWMTIPLELIVKMYRDNNDSQFSSLEEYVTDFLKYLEANFKKYVSERQQTEVVEYRIYQGIDLLTDLTNDFINDLITDGQINHPKTLEEESEVFIETFKDILDVVLDELKKGKVSQNFKNYTIQKFKKQYGDVLNNIINGFFISNKTKKDAILKNKLIEYVFYELIAEVKIDGDFTGLVFAGYGNDEIYPGIIDIRLSFIVDNIIKYDYGQKSNIGEGKTAIIQPYAQREMVDTFFQGIDPKLYEEIGKLLENLLEDFKSSLINKYSRISKRYLKSEIDALEVKFHEKIFQLRNEIHVMPIVDTIEVLRKEDLVEVAESLVGITSLKRKTTLDVETVGGPVDIAVITKGEGFLWVKRKENINKDLNHLFFERESNKLK